MSVIRLTEQGMATVGASAMLLASLTIASRLLGAAGAAAEQSMSGLFEDEPT